MVLDPRLRWLATLDRPNRSNEDEQHLRRLLDETPIKLVLGGEHPGDLRHQVTFTTAANLLARLFRKLYLVVPPTVEAHSALPFVSGPLGSALAGFCRQIHANVDVRVVGNIHEAIEGGVTLVVGHAPQTSDTALYCEGADWNVYVGRQPLPLQVAQPANVIGALAAAAMGAAEVFKVVFEEYIPVAKAQTLKMSLLDYRTEITNDPPPVTNWCVPGTVLVGAGSIGSAFLWAAAHFPMLSGIMNVVDKDIVLEHNPDRAILTFPSDCDSPKASVCTDRIQEYLPLLDLQPHQMEITEYVSSLPDDYRIPIMISAVDNIEARRDIQDSFPQITLNAATGPTKVEISRHRFNDGLACLYCQFLPVVMGKSRRQILQEQTGLDAKLVAELTVTPGRTLQHVEIRRIEHHRNLRPGSLQEWLGRSLDDLMSHVGYSQAPVELPNGRFLVTTAFVSAFAGVLLMGEMLKQIDPALEEYRLCNFYTQNLIQLPNEYKLTMKQESTRYCLCHDEFRQQIYADKWHTQC